MKKIALSAILVVVSFLLVACAPKATQEDCNNTCRKLENFKAAANPPAEDPVAKVEAEFQKKLADVEAEKATALKPIEDELQAKLAAAKKDKEKAKLTEDYGKKKEEKGKEFQGKIDTINQEKATALKAAEEQKAKIAADRKTAMDKAIADCAKKCIEAGTPKTKTDCQLKAATMADFNKCQ